ncbi:hypothetical protein F4811DRAFT_550276 [Daldinia bambusicola]|nr:hypothetical protein F4811DRAFT_550276 [Daldinia bambusicola]
MSAPSSIGSKTETLAPAPATEAIATPATPATPRVFNKRDPQYQMECLQKLKQYMGWILKWTAKNKTLCNPNGEAENGGEAEIATYGRVLEVLGVTIEGAVTKKNTVTKHITVAEKTAVKKKSPAIENTTAAENTVTESTTVTKKATVAEKNTATENIMVTEKTEVAEESAIAENPTVTENHPVAEMTTFADMTMVAGKVGAAREPAICGQTGTSAIIGIVEKTYTFHTPDANCPTTSPITMNAGSHIPSHSGSLNANKSKATPGHNTYFEVRNSLGGKTQWTNTIPHCLLDADEAAAKSVRYGEIPHEHLAHPESYANQYIEIKKSHLGGYGAFAKTDLKCGQLILAEQPALKANPITLYQDIAELAPELRAAFYRMHGHKRSPAHDKRQAIFLTNAFVVRESSIVYFIAARFNHACGQVRSVKYHITPNNIIELRMAKDVLAGTELTISYGPLPPANLYLMWGFRCACGGCKPLTDAQVEKLNYRDEVEEDVW